MQDTLIICYTRSGTTAVAAKKVSRMTGWRIGWVSDVVPRLDWWGTCRCTLEGLLGLDAPYAYRGPKPGRYQHVVVMGPVWMGSMASPLRRFIVESNRSSDPKDHLPPSVSCIYVMADSGGPRLTDRTSSPLGRAPHPVLLLKAQQVLDRSAHQMLMDFVRAINKLDDEAPFAPVGEHLPRRPSLAIDFTRASP